MNTLIPDVCDNNKQGAREARGRRVLLLRRRRKRPRASTTSPAYPTPRLASTEFSRSVQQAAPHVQKVARVVSAPDASCFTLIPGKSVISTRYVSLRQLLAVQNMRQLLVQGGALRVQWWYGQATEYQQAENMTECSASRSHQGALKFTSASCTPANYRTNISRCYRVASPDGPSANMKAINTMILGIHYQNGK